MWHELLTGLQQWSHDIVYETV